MYRTTCRKILCPSCQCSFHPLETHILKNVDLFIYMYIEPSLLSHKTNQSAVWTRLLVNHKKVAWQWHKLTCPAKLSTMLYFTLPHPYLLAMSYFLCKILDSFLCRGSHRVCSVSSSNCQKMSYFYRFPHVRGEMPEINARVSSSGILSSFQHTLNLSWHHLEWY